MKRKPSGKPTIKSPSGPISQPLLNWPPGMATSNSPNTSPKHSQGISCRDFIGRPIPAKSKVSLPAGWQEPGQLSGFCVSVHITALREAGSGGIMFLPRKKKVPRRFSAGRGDGRGICPALVLYGQVQDKCRADGSLTALVLCDNGPSAVSSRRDGLFGAVLLLCKRDTSRTHAHA